MRVRVFRNLTSKCLSIQSKTVNGWRTVAHADAVQLSSCAFRVSEAGRQRVLATGKKTVHAWVEGDLLGWRGEFRPVEWGSCIGINGFLWLLDTAEGADWVPGALPSPITYNPRKGPAFHALVDGVAVHAAPRVMLTTKGMTAQLTA